jgi:KUP system potassium uptake protein
MSLGVFPKLKIVHTNSFVEGQIFIPFINYTLMVLCIAVVAGFEGDAVKLGDAYGEGVKGGEWEARC